MRTWTLSDLDLILKIAELAGQKILKIYQKGSPLISSQTFAVECATGTSLAEGCTIDVSNI